MYEYRATVVANVDGDTIHCEIDLGVDVRTYQTLRFAGINAPEVSTAEGKQVAAWVASVIPPGTVFTLRTAKDRREKYGRYLAWLLLADGSCLNRTLVDSGRAVAYGDLPIDPPPA